MDAGRPGGRREAAARVGERDRGRQDLLRLRELEPLEVRRGELAERQALEIRAPRLARDVERVARVPLDAAEVAFPPADGREQRERLRPRVARRVGEQLDRLAAELPPLLDVGVPVEPDLGDLDEREALGRPIPRLACLLAHGLHLDGGSRELPQPPRCPGGAVAAAEARLELDRAQQQPARPAVRLALERPAARVLEGGRGLGAEVVGDAPVELRQQRGGTLEVERLRLDEVVRTRAQPFGERAVERCADALREPAVGDVADQDVPEPVRDLARDRRDRLARQDLAVDEIGERGVDVQVGVELGDRAAPEHAADQGAVAEHRPRFRRQGVDPGRDERLQGVRDPHGGTLSLLDEHPHGLLDEERVALGLVEEDAPQPVRQGGALHERVDERRRLGVRQRRQLDRDRPSPSTAPARARVQELRAGEADDEHRRVVDPVREMLDQVEQGLLGPVDVLEAEHERLRLGEARRPLVRGPGDLEAAAAARDVVEHAGREPEQVRHRVARARLPELLDRLLRRVVVGDPRRRLHHLRERPVRDALPERRAPSREDARALEPREELLREPALADPGVAEDRHELRTPVANDTGEDVAEHVELLLAADVRRRDADRSPRRAVGADDAPHLDRAVQPLQRAVAERLDGHAPGRETVRRRADQDLAGLRALLEACGDVERLTGGEGRVTRLRDDLAGLDPDPHGQVSLARLEDGDGCAHGALGVVLVRDRHAEHGHDRVSGELLDRPAVRRDVRRGTVEERGHAAPDDLRVASGDECGGIDEIDEQRRRELALHGRSLGSREEAPRGGFPHLAARRRTSSL